MRIKIEKAIIAIVILFILGNILVFTGYIKGTDIAFSLSGQNMMDEEWYVPEGLVFVSTFLPVIIGMTSIILSIIFTSVLFIDWYKKDINTEREGE